MQVGILLLFNNHQDHADAQMYRNEVRLAVEAEAMGYDIMASVEHHFDDYSMCPDNSQLLSHIAGKTSRIKLMPAAFILPWNDPLRVAEKIVLLDILSEGRAILGMGRGLARAEFDGFRIPMAEARGRFDEAIEMIINGIETGFVEGNGPFYKQPRVELRPRPVKSFKDRTYMVSMSPSSAAVATKLGIGCFKFASTPWEQVKPEVEAYRQGYKKLRGHNAPPIFTADYVAIAKDPKKVDLVKKHLYRFGVDVLNHYEMTKAENFQTKDGSYDSYAEAAKELNKLSEQQRVDALALVNLVGTPEEIIERLAARRSLIGDFDLVLSFSFGSIDYELVREQMKLFAEEVLPVVRSWGPAMPNAAQ